MTRNKRKTTYGEQLKQYRLKKGWTLEQIANAVELHKSSLCRIEKGRVTPRELTKASIKRAFPDFNEAA